MRPAPDKRRKKTGWADLREALLNSPQGLKIRAYMREYHRARSELLKSLHLCVNCGREDALPGMTLCMGCRLYHNQMRSGATVAHSPSYRPKGRQKAKTGLVNAGEEEPPALSARA